MIVYILCHLSICDKFFAPLEIETEINIIYVVKRGKISFIMGRQRIYIYNNFSTNGSKNISTNKQPNCHGENILEKLSKWIEIR